MVLAAVFTWTLVLAAACDSRKSQVAIAPQPVSEALTLRRGLGGDASTFDPQKVGDQYSDQIARDLFEGLMTRGSDGELILGAAESWKASDDGLTYTFRLRPGLVWSNGDPLRADEFAAGLRRATSPKTAAPLADSLLPIENARGVLAGDIAVERLGVSTPDPQTVVIRLERPAPYLLDVLASPISYPLHTRSVAPDGNLEAAPGRLVSNGAYCLAQVRQGDRITLTKNLRFREASLVTFERVEYFPISDVNAELMRYRAGELDITSTLPASQLDWARRERPSELQIGPMQAIAYVVFDTAEGVLSRDPALREALALVIDRRAIAEKVLKAGQTPWYSMVAPQLGTYRPARYSWADEDLIARIARARALMGRAGYGPNRPLRLRFLHHQNESLRNAALAIGALWKERLDVEVIFEEREFRTFLQVREDRPQWDVLITALGASYQDPSTFLSSFRSGAPDNDSGLRDAKFDALLKSAELTAGSQQRQVAFRAAEERLLDVYAATPVYLLVSRRLVAPKLKIAGLQTSPTLARFVALKR
jgi:oligopeptide transport system substrate-binding protein